MNDTDVKEYRRRVAELEAEVAGLRAWRKQLLDEGFGYDDSEESVKEVLDWAPAWRAQEIGTAARAEAAEAERDQLAQRLDQIRALIPTSNPELIEAGYAIPAEDLLRVLDGDQRTEEPA